MRVLWCKACLNIIVSYLARVLRAVAGMSHTVCVMKDGSAMSFGSGSFGKLGHGDIVQQSTPKAIAGLGTNVQTCSAGEFNAASIWHRHSVTMC
jgi:alpha-tubulin suppressor-like RCC1 family protein